MSLLNKEISPYTEGANPADGWYLIAPPVASVVPTADNGDPIDRVIVRFDEGKTLNKLQIRDGNTKLYIPQDGEDYAIVSVGVCRDGVHTVSTREMTAGVYVLRLVNDKEVKTQKIIIRE